MSNKEIQKGNGDKMDSCIENQKERLKSKMHNEEWMPGEYITHKIYWKQDEPRETLSSIANKFM